MKKVVLVVLKIIKWLLLALIFLIVLFLFIRMIIQKVRLNKSINNNEISEIREVQLGDYKQKILLEGKEKSLPLLVILHGGPAAPIAFGNGYRGVYSKLTDNYLVIEWDQYGCGNNRADFKNLLVNDYIKMGEDLIKYLHNKFPNNKIYLFGMSWGTILGANIAYKYSDYIDKYISYGTFTYMQNAYQYLIEQLLNENLKELDRNRVNELSKEKYSYDNIIELQTISLNYNLSVQGIDKMDNFMYKTILNILFSPDYTIKEVIGVLNNNVLDTKIYKELNDIDVTDILKSINIPIYIIQGKYDNQTPHYVIDNIVSTNANFSYYELANSGHYLTKKDFENLIDYLISLK